MKSQKFFISFLLIAVLGIDAAEKKAAVKAVVLGVAQDGGIPQIGCDQKICKTTHRYISSVALLGERASYLIDPTPDLRHQYMEFVKRYPQAKRPNLFDGIFLTHAHMGHYSGLLYLGKESISTKKVPVYCSAEMAQFLESNAPWNLLITNGNIEIRKFQSGNKVELIDFSVTPLSVPHRREFTDTHGFLIQGPTSSILYIPDIDAWEPVRGSISNWLSNCDFALLDGTFYSGNELPGRDMRLVPHPTMENSFAFFQSLPPFSCSIFFTHFNHTNPVLDPESPELKSLIKTRYQIATDWQEFPL